MKRYIAMLLSLIVAISGVTAFAETEYSASDWAREELERADSIGIIPEELSGADFAEAITRLDFSRVLVKTYEKLMMTELSLSEEKPFSDVDDEAVLKAYGAGFIQGMGDGLFLPEELLSREQAAAMLTRIYKKALYADWTIDKDEEFIPEYDAGEELSDGDELSDWAEESVYFMLSKEIVNGVGDNKFAPKSNISAEQAIIIALRLKETIEREDEYQPDPYVDVERGDVSTKKGENDYLIAFIGGSLTAGGTEWIKATRELIQGKMPDKNVTTLNAGKGGTTSAYGALRFSDDVAPYEPDLLFIEFAANDADAKDKSEFNAYMESILYQCKQMKNEPIVIFLYAPIPVEKDSDRYSAWEDGVNNKELLAKHYGIKSINIYEYMQREYESTKAEQGYKTFSDYLATMYRRSGDGFNVHGGYTKYGEAIVEALTEDYEGCMSPMKDVNIYCNSQKNLVRATYTQTDITSDRIHYAGAWESYTASNPFTATDTNATVDSGHYKYPFFTKGISQLYKAKGAVGIETKAEAVCLNYISATAGSNAKVYVDGKETGTMKYWVSNHGVNYVSDWVKLPNDGKKHSVIYLVDDPTASSYVFRFGSFVERFMDK